jgi:hypothetical protein
LLLLPLQPVKAELHSHSRYANHDQSNSCHLSRRVASLWVLLSLLVLAFAVGAGEGPAEGEI